ncbi:diguanylate cyclase [Azoarcus indigens]|uniref:PAS domain S-box-containing protein/diguanylate cyclase (GGDEF)-like protein n=1 Tax=Azoarcus indigens TaxID=29545 RepID=A0A4R6DWI7_9RHOO|nr:diguanylate cyclase [Azoarcus indigens]NMG67711.1 diguanylate cyclase [Azoarcus indigens]TDN49645.1 PAS domain S-box-containing protein/diguanylate cyclase (GGDEF)-like protein [Azoarcus indigens]
MTRYESIIFPAPAAARGPGRRAALACLLALLVQLALAQAPAGAAAADEAGRLNAAERAWLAAHAVIRYGAHPASAPYSYLTPQGHRGADAELMALLGQRLDVRFEFHPYTDWDETLRAAEHGDIDVVSPMIPTGERRAYLLFTQPVYRLKFGVFMRNSKPYIEDLDDLSGERVGVQRSSLLRQELEKAQPLLTLTQVETLEQGLERVAANELDALIGPISQVSHFVRVRNFDDIDLRLELPEQMSRAIGVRKDWSELVAILDKTLPTVAAERRRALERNWLGDRPRGFTAAQISSVAVPSLAVMAAALAVLMIGVNKRLRDSEARASLLFRNHSAVMLQVDASSRRVVDANPAAVRYYGYPRSQLIGMPLVQLNTLPEEDLARLVKATADDQARRFIVTHKLANGSLRDVEVFTSPAVVGGRTILLSIIHDITEQLNAEAQLQRMASYDPLTELPNRRLFMNRLREELARRGREQGQFALLFVDLDGFKAVNDRHGHDAGDRLLRELSGRLRNCVRESDTVARLGGDEFTLLLPDAETAADAAAVALKVIEAASREVVLDGGLTAQVSASVGIALYPAHGREADLLLSNADSAMYRAKAEGRNRYAFATANAPGPAADTI